MINLNFKGTKQDLPQAFMQKLPVKHVSECRFNLCDGSGTIPGIYDSNDRQCPCQWQDEDMTGPELNDHDR